MRFGGSIWMGAALAFGMSACQVSHEEDHRNQGDHAHDPATHDGSEASESRQGKESVSQHAGNSAAHHAGSARFDYTKYCELATGDKLCKLLQARLTMLNTLAKAQNPDGTFALNGGVNSLPDCSAQATAYSQAMATATNALNALQACLLGSAQPAPVPAPIPSTGPDVRPSEGLEFFPEDTEAEEEMMERLLKWALEVAR